MKTFGIICGLVGLALAAGSIASAAEPSTSISTATLASMGLGSMQSMSDAQGTTVRGLGTFAGHHFDKRMTHVRFDHKKMDHRRVVDHKGGHNFKDFHHKKLGHDFGHKKMDFHHKSFGHWPVRTLTWSFGGSKLR
jgi:hypothetical protein